MTENPNFPTTLRVRSAGELPLNCVLTLKAGSTFLRNLFHVLEHGTTHPDPDMIHQSDRKTVRHLTREQLAEDISFFVLRNPIDRFFSLYFDKVIGPTPRNFPWIAAALTRNRVFHAGQDLTIEQHRENCTSLAGFVKFRFKLHEIDEVNPHWRPQIDVIGSAIQFGLKPLLQENLVSQLLQITDGRIPGLQDAIDTVGRRNKSKRQVSASDILTPQIEKLICELYEDDMALYKLLVEGWKAGQPPDLGYLVEK